MRALLPVLRCTLAPLLLLRLMAAAGAWADDPGDLGGFDDEDGFELDLAAEPTAPVLPERWWDLDGSIGISSSINYLSHNSSGGDDMLPDDYTGVSRLRARLDLELDAELPHEWQLRVSPYVWYDFSYLINGLSNFSGPVLEAYEWEGDFQDSYLEGPLLDPLDLKVGRQVVNWGRSDTLRVLDVLNPLDNREPPLGAKATTVLPDGRNGAAAVTWFDTQALEFAGEATPRSRATAAIDGTDADATSSSCRRLPA